MSCSPNLLDFDKIEVDGNQITAGVGAKLKEVAYAAKGAGLGGLEWMEGIPGEVGGGLRMNAGAMGAQTFERVLRVRYLDEEGIAHTKKAGELEVRYRHVPSLIRNYAVSAAFAENPLPRKKSQAAWMNHNRNVAAHNRSQKAPAAFSKIPIAVRQENWWMSLA